MNFEKIDRPITESAGKDTSLEEVAHQFPPIPHIPEQVLNVQAGASNEELDRAYHNLSKLYHPDIHNDSPDATAWMRALSEARQILKRRNTASTVKKTDTIRTESFRERAKRESEERITEKEREIQDLVWEGTEVLFDPEVKPSDKRLLSIKQRILALKQEVASMLGMRPMQYDKQRRYLFEAGLAEHRSKLIDKVLEPFDKAKEETEARIVQIQKAIEARYQKHPLDKILRPDKISLKELEMMLTKDTTTLRHIDTKRTVTRHDLETRVL